MSQRRCTLCFKFARLFASGNGHTKSVLTCYKETTIKTHLRRQWRVLSLFPGVADRLYTISQRKKDYRQERVLGFTPEQIYSVVVDIDNYKSFLPWCQASDYLTRGEPQCSARLAIGFPPLIEEYTASVTASTNGRLFTRLDNAWYFRRGPDLDSGPTCLVNFWISFEFRNSFYAQLGFLVFDEVARTMYTAFEARSVELYGPDHLKARGVQTALGLKKLLEQSKSYQTRRQGKLMETD